MSTNCYCDYDPPVFCRAAIRTARKQYACDECNGIILAGEKYEYTSGKWDVGIDVFRTCIHCRNIRVWTKNNIPCLCWAHGHMIEDCQEAVEEACYRASDETAGLMFGFLRLVVIRDRLNRDRRKKA